MHAGFPGGYNFPVFVVGHSMWAFHGQGHWSSSDGKRWTQSTLPLSGLNSAYQKYVQLGDAVYSLGTMRGNYLSMQLTSRIARTRNFTTWETVAETSNLPRRVFYGAVVMQNRIWLLGGWDGTRYYNDVWTSTDAVHWTRVVEHAPWSARNTTAVVVFRNTIWIIGGGVIDGEREINPNASREVWSSPDGVQWTKTPERAGPALNGTPVVFDDRLWLVGSNRNGAFDSAVWSTSDGEHWQSESAPWSARGAPAPWVFDNQLYITGGKYSETRNGQIEFLYRDDVWRMSKRGAPLSRP